jgi:DNA-binding response OmpR family regulator
MRILVVEDDRGLAAQIARGLQEENHTVEVVADGLEALDYGPLIAEGVYAR